MVPAKTHTHRRDGRSRDRYDHCKKHPERVVTQTLTETARQAAARGDVDDLSHLAKARVYLYLGTQDPVYVRNKLQALTCTQASACGAVGLQHIRMAVLRFCVGDGDAAAAAAAAAVAAAAVAAAAAAAAAIAGLLVVLAMMFGVSHRCSTPASCKGLWPVWFE